MDSIKRLTRRQYLILMSASAATVAFENFGNKTFAQETPCRMARVTILSIIVNKSESYGVLKEPGASAEWDLRFTVAGQQQARRIDGVKNESVLAIDMSFVVDLNSIDEILEISVSGEEIDDSSANDSLPRATYSIVPKDNWKSGKTYDKSASNKDFSYSFTFRIECADAVSTKKEPLTSSDLSRLRYDAIWTPGNDGRPIVWGYTYEDLQKQNSKHYANGYRLTHQQSYDIGGGSRRYDAIWTPGNDGRPIVWGYTYEDLQKQNSKHYANGYRLTHQQSYDIGGGSRRYDAIWTPGNDGRPIVWGYTYEDLQKQNSKHYANGYRLTHQQSYDIGGGSRRYDAIWTPGNDGRPIVWGYTYEDLQKQNSKHYANGYRLTHQQSYDIGGGSRRYDAIWTPGNDGRPIVWGYTYEDLQKQNSKHYANGYRLTHQQSYFV